jgi:hypothetical protein
LPLGFAGALMATVYYHLSDTHRKRPQRARGSHGGH